jgi:hypothetical protein
MAGHGASVLLIDVLDDLGETVAHENPLRWRSSELPPCGRTGAEDSQQAYAAATAQFGPSIRWAFPWA